MISHSSCPTAWVKFPLGLNIISSMLRGMSVTGVDVNLDVFLTSTLKEGE